MPDATSRPTYVPERLDHLAIVAGVCSEVGLTEWLDAQDERIHERVSVGTVTVAMILPDDPQSGQEADESTDHALGLSVFRGCRDAAHPPRAR